MRPLTIGSRGSALAVAQAEHVRALLLSRRPDLAVALRVIRTAGDRDAERAARAFPIKGIFVKELEDELRRGGIDLAVHSVKDLPGELAPGLTLAAHPRREDPRDALLARAGEDLAGLAPGSRVGTGSVRRSAQIRRHRPDLRFVDMRGNVDTRVRRVEAGDVEAVILAMAGLSRLGLASGRARPLAVEVCLPAPGQGAIGVQARDGDVEVIELLGTIDDPAARCEVAGERAVLAALKAGCTVPLGALARAHGDRVAIEAAVASVDGSCLVRAQAEGQASQSARLGSEVARRLLDAGAGEILGGWWAATGPDA